MTKKTVSPKHRKGKENKLGVRRWTGADVKEMRRRHAPPGKLELTHQQLAELMGFGDRTAIGRFESQTELALLPSLAFELTDRILTARKPIGAEANPVLAQMSDSAETSAIELQVKIADCAVNRFALDVSGSDIPGVRLTLVLDAAKLKLQVTALDSGEQICSLALLETSVAAAPKTK